MTTENDQFDGVTDAELRAAEAMALAQLADAEAVEAQAKVAAAAAHLRAVRLRQLAQEAAASQIGITEEATATSTVEVEARSRDTQREQDQRGMHHDSDDSNDPKKARGTFARIKPTPRTVFGWLRRRIRAAVLTLVALATCVLVATSGYMLWDHHKCEHDRHLNAEFSAAARQGVINLMSLDFKTAKTDLQRLVDNSTGALKKDLEGEVDNIAKMAQDSKLITTVTVNAAAVQSKSDRSAVVLVAATSERSEVAKTDREKRSWRSKVTVDHVGGQFKMSSVEFLP